MRLPLLNFVTVDWIRNVSKEPVGQRVFGSMDPVTKTVQTSRPAMHFDLTYSCSLFCSDYKERDHVLYQLYCAFPRGEVSLIYRDPLGKTEEDYIFMPLKLDDNMVDATELENSDMKETRDVIRTDFTMHGQSVVPYPSKEVKAIEHVYYVDRCDEVESKIGYDMMLKNDGEIVVDISQNVPFP
jgi:hypothetical protein